MQCVAAEADAPDPPKGAAKKKAPKPPPTGGRGGKKSAAAGTAQKPPPPLQLDSATLLSSLHSSAWAAVRAAFKRRPAGSVEKG